MAKGPLRITREGQIPSIRRPGPGTLDFALRSIRGGKYQFMDLATFAIGFEPRLEPVVLAWAEMTPWQRRVTTLEKLIAPTTLTAGEFLGAVVRASFEVTGEITDLLVALAFPDIVLASVKRARMGKGVEDRRLLFEHAEFLSGPESQVPDPG